MKALLISLFLVSSLSTFASTFEKESISWTKSMDWTVYDEELKTSYQFLPMNEKVHDYFQSLDRRYDYDCFMKERNLRQFFESSTVVIAVYNIKDCKKTGKNPNW